MPKTSKKSKQVKPYRFSTNYYRILNNETKKKKTVVSPKKYKNKNKTQDADSLEPLFFNKIDEKTEFFSSENVDDSCSENSFKIKDDYKEIDGQIMLTEKLRLWALNYKITLNAVTGLLETLRASGIEHLPKDGRTLLKTPTSTEILNMGSGKFWYNGVGKNLTDTLSQLRVCPSEISLLINIDGMSPFNSSNHQFWPICFLISEFKFIKPMIAAIYYGDCKPPLLLYFKDFVSELKTILQDGIIVKDQLIKVNLKCFVCDTQARSFIKGTPACNAENGSCIKCTVTGKWDTKGRHMSYPNINCPLRTDFNFRRKIDEDHHKEDTPLCGLPIDMVKDFVVSDSLHLLDLGIMRKCLYGWREGSYNFRSKLSRNQTEQLSLMLESCNQSKPIEINRAIRTLKSLKFWKGSEYRVFLLYLGIVVLKDFLRPEIYEHFLLLNCAVSILSCHEYSKYVGIADKLLQEYIEKYKKLYGKDSISSNVHNLCHVVEDVKRFGPLSEISSYPFENALGYIKTLVRHGNQPLSQISRRVIELSNINTLGLPYQQSITYLSSHQIQKIHECSKCEGVYKKIHISKVFVLSADAKNRWFLTKYSEIISMINATHCNNKMYVYGEKVKEIYDFYKKPFASSKLHVYATQEVPRQEANEECSIQFEKPKLYSLNEIKCKLFRIQYHAEYIFLPLIHTLDFERS